MIPLDFCLKKEIAHFTIASIGKLYIYILNFNYETNTKFYSERSKC